LKIIAILETDAGGSGGFNQAVNAILQMQRICERRFDFEVLTAHQSNVGPLASLGVAATVFSFSAIDAMLARASHLPSWQSLQLRLKLTGPFERKLLQRGCDLVYFVMPSAKATALQRLNYIATVWDACHRDAPEFPEVRQFAQFQAREHQYRTQFAPAIAVLTDSRELAASLCRRYGLDPERMLPMPFAPAPFLQAGLAADTAAVLSKYGLQEGYYFYPAQFWAHKNHARILEAMTLLRERGSAVRAVFAGGDAGNRPYIEALAARHGLRDQLSFLGHVPSADLRGLYEGCCAVVMPTYFGPTNLPPLEAWLIGKPLIYSSAFKEQAADAALGVNPDDASALADAMHACTDADTRANLVRSGTLRLRQIEQQREEAEAALLERLRQFEAKRSCWPSSRLEADEVPLRP